MKQLIGFTGSFVLLCMLFSSLILPSFTRAATKNTDDNIAVAVDQAAPADAPKFILSGSEGRVAAFRFGEDKPFFVSDTRIADLPKEDALRLSQGIPVSTRQQLGKLIEDLCS